jgi:hypothetical protein
MSSSSCLSSRRALQVGVLVGVFVLGPAGCRGKSGEGKEAGKTGNGSYAAAGLTINKQPENFAMRTFNPSAPPSDMPPLREGENAQCESAFLTDANVAGETQPIDGSHGKLKITKITVTLNLNVTIWAPNGASQHIVEHEQGHRQISEYYYQTAERVAEEIAASYMGRLVDVSGSDLSEASRKMLGQIAAEINEEYGRQLNPEAAQLLYDSITDHSRNDVVARDAAVHALKNAAVETAGT